jgi:hypothetical protein
MPKIVVMMSISVDGFTQGPNGEIDWLAALNSQPGGDLAVGRSARGDRPERQASRERSSPGAVRHWRRGPPRARRCA